MNNHEKVEMIFTVSCLLFFFSFHFLHFVVIKESPLNRYEYILYIWSVAYIILDYEPLGTKKILLSRLNNKWALARKLLLVDFSFFYNVKIFIFSYIVFLGYAFLVTWITAFVMVVVHERVPDSKRYPPLPDIFLDNVPLISWAFFACEVTGSLLFSIWVCVLIFHKHR